MITREGVNMIKTKNRQLPVKAGKLIKDNNQKAILLNDSGKAFSTNLIIVEIWELCNGENSTESIISNIHSKFNTMKKNEILTIIEKLLKTELIKLF